MTYGQSSCGICDPLGVFRCINEETYQLCINNVGVGVPTQCTSGSVCSINQISVAGGICQVPDMFPSSHDCESQCIGICPSSDLSPGQIRYICTGPNRYRFCNELYDDEDEYICPVGSICTIDAPCVRNGTNVAALCPNSNPINPDPNTLCVGKLDRTRNPLVPPDPFCEK